MLEQRILYKTVVKEKFIKWLRYIYAGGGGAGRFLSRNSYEIGRNIVILYKITKHSRWIISNQLQNYFSKRIFEKE